MPVLEAAVEAYLVRRVKALGGMALKFTSPGRRGVPDRMVLLPNGVFFFVELKRPGERATKQQELMRRRLQDLGLRAFVASSVGEVAALLNPFDPIRR